MTGTNLGSSDVASVLILDGKALIDKIRPQMKKNEQDPFVISLARPAAADLQNPACECDPYLYHILILSSTELEESDFLYELRLARSKALGVPEKQNPAWYEFVYVSFDSYLSASNKDKDKDACMEALFRQGFRLAGEDGPVLVPFDKSASMARKSRISFLREDIVPEMNRRLDMDLFTYDDDNCIQTLSKYYAYRALSMSGGNRIDSGILELNEKTVVVIKVPSAKHDKKNPQTVFTADIEEESHKITFSSEKDQIESVSFDGEGMISPAAADALSAALGYQKGQEQPTSFQIRMPFAKGMLHKLDFRRFCIEEYGIPEKDYDNGTAKIRDYFGIERSVKDIAIVMTDTMFKEAGYMQVRFEREKKAGGKILFGDDPMAYYFAAYRKYDRALYILRTNKSLSDRGHVLMNYQFLATSRIEEDSLGKLLDQSLRETALPLILQGPEYDEAKIANLTGSNADSSDEAEDDADYGEDWNQEDAQPNGLRERYAMAVRKNPELINDKAVRDELRWEAGNRVLRAVWKGQIEVSGLNLYLSEDLLFFMSAFAKNIKIVWEDSEEKAGLETEERLQAARIENRFWDFVKDRALHTIKVEDGVSRFYAPAANQRLQTDSVEKDPIFAVLRSPHLSRNEQCAMKAYFPRSRKENLYQKYCGHLSGVIMLPWKNRIADRLGGADYDGDLVKVIIDGTIAKSAKDCMNSPTVVIPHAPAMSEPVPSHVRYSDIRDSLGSRVGQLSNAAVRISSLQYSGKMMDALKLIGQDAEQLGLPLDPDGQPDFAAACCILVGLEVDRAKTGIEPDGTVIEIGNKAVKAYREKQADDEPAHSSGTGVKSSNTKLGPVILDERETLQSIDLNRKIEQDADGSMTCKFTFQKSGEIRLRAPKAGDAILDRLPYEALSTWKGLCEDNADRFRAPRSGLWEQKAEGPLLERVESILLAAKDVSGEIQVIRNIQKEMGDISDPYFHNAVRFLILQGETGGDAYHDATLLRDMIHSALEDPKRGKQLLSLIDDRSWSAKGPCSERARELEECLVPAELPKEQSLEWKLILPKLFEFSSWGFLILPYLISSARIVDGKAVHDLFSTLQGSTRTAIRKLTLPVEKTKEKEEEKETTKGAALSDVFLQTFGTASALKLRKLQQEGKELADELSSQEETKEEQLPSEALAGWIPDCACRTSLAELKELTSCDPFFSLTAKTAAYRARLLQEVEPSLVYYTAMEVEHPDSFDRPQEKLWSLVRGELEKLFPDREGNLAAAIPYWAACSSIVDANHRILWNIFTPNEISSTGGRTC